MKGKSRANEGFWGTPFEVCGAFKLKELAAIGGFLIPGPVS